MLKGKECEGILKNNQPLDLFFWYPSLADICGDRSFDS